MKYIEQKIVITTDGKETLARLYEGKKVIKSASAKCSPDDEFGFNTGVRIAFDRLMDEKPVEEVKSVEAPKFKIKVGKKYILKPWKDVTEPHALSEAIWERYFSKPVKVIREHEIEKGVFLVDGGWWVKASSFLCEHTKKFVPHLIYGGEHYGNIGEPTIYKDAVGRPLCIGDVVELFSKCKKCKSHGLTAVVRTQIGHGYKKEKTFVMGIEMCCDDQNGTIEDWSIIKTRDYSEVKNGEKIDGIKYVTKE